MIACKWLLCAAPMALVAGNAAAQTVSADAAATAQVETPAATDATDAPSGDIVVLGFGRTRQVQTVSAIEMERLTPGTSPLKAIAKLPDGAYRAELPQMPAGKWRVVIDDPRGEWRLAKDSL